MWAICCILNILYIFFAAAVFFCILLQRAEHIGHFMIFFLSQEQSAKLRWKLSFVIKIFFTVSRSRRPFFCFFLLRDGIMNFRLVHFGAMLHSGYSDCWRVMNEHKHARSRLSESGRETRCGESRKIHQNLSLAAREANFNISLYFCVIFFSFFFCLLLRAKKNIFLIIIFFFSCFFFLHWLFIFLFFFASSCFLKPSTHSRYRFRH